MTHEAGQGFGRKPYALLETGRYPYPETVLFTSDFAVITGTSNKKLAKDVGALLKKEIQETASTFADGETRIHLTENVRRNEVFVLQPICPPGINDHLMELIFMIDAAKRSSATEITAITPYFGYARQDRKDQPRVPISAAVVAEMIKNAGAERIVTLDIHSEQTQSAFSGPWDNMYGSIALVPRLEEKGWEGKNITVFSPDAGGVKRAKAYKTRLNAGGLAVAFKERNPNVPNEAEMIDMIGDVDGKDVLFADDMVDTAGSIVEAAQLVRSRGARRIAVAATHGLFSGPALKRLEDSPIETVFVTDSVDHSDAVRSNPKIDIVTIAPLMAEVIKRIYVGVSLSELVQ